MRFLGLLLVLGCRFRFDQLATDSDTLDAGALDAGAASNADVLDGASKSTCVGRMDGGDAHACAVRNDGSLWCWGANSLGQIGDGTVVDRPLPTHVMDSVQDVSAGMNDTCVLKTDHTVWCWGRNAVG